jgi:hypothetical protein
MTAAELVCRQAGLPPQHKTVAPGLAHGCHHVTRLVVCPNVRKAFYGSSAPGVKRAGTFYGHRKAVRGRQSKENSAETSIWLAGFRVA